MAKTILITGSTDGIGLAAAEKIVEQGHNVLIHGRNQYKLESAKQQLLAKASANNSSNNIETYLADLTSLADTKKFADDVKANHSRIDAVINNAGVLTSPVETTEYGVDIRVIVNTIAPYQLTIDLLPILDRKSRVVNVSSAAQSPVKLADFFSVPSMKYMDAYSQSKLAIVMWTRHLVKTLNNAPVMIAVNPGSLLASKMVKEGFGIDGKDIYIGANILSQLALEPKHSVNTGKYFDNDSAQFSQPHPAGLDDKACAKLVSRMDVFIAENQH